MNTDQNALRKYLKQIRSNIGPRERAAANRAANQAIINNLTFRKAKNIAAFIGSKGELDPMPALEAAHKQGKKCYLPVLHPFLHGKLLFARWSPETHLVQNHFGILEPIIKNGHVIKASALDLVVTPLLGFDSNCQRLGMGGGYYDRTFAFRNRRKVWRGPLLYGFAFEAQNTQGLSTNPWDIKLDCIITEKYEYYPRKGLKNCR